MDLLFKREQTAGKLARVNFKLWSKVELDDEEQALVKRYGFDKAVLIAILQPDLLRQAGLVGIAIFALAMAVLLMIADGGLALFLALGAGIGGGCWYACG